LNPDPDGDLEPKKPELTDNKMMVYAARLLARREYAVRELETRLLRKWPHEAQIEQRVSQLVQTLVNDGALSDERFTESFIRSRRRKYQGPVKIRAELRQRQVPDSIIEHGLLPLEEDWTSLAATWLSHQCHEPLDFKGRAKYYRRLMNRGFSHQQAMDALAIQSKN
jgi:regulatory protein